MRENNDHSFASAERLSETPRPQAGGVEEQMNFGFDALTQATLALAYEQRTANLVAWMSLGVNASASGVEITDEVRRDICERLGVEVEES